jgi:hypothetical protein
MSKLIKNKSKNWNKPALYFSYLVATLIVFEVFLIYSSFIFSNLTDRIRLKSAMFEYRDSTEILFIGSSRFKDGISPKIVSEVFNKNGNVRWSAFNGATTGTNMNRLEYFFNNSVVKPGLVTIIIEISLPQLSEGILGFNSEAEPRDFEEKLQQTLSSNLRLSEYRKSFRLEHLMYAPAIVGASYFEGSELFRKNIIPDLLSEDKFNLSEERLNKWQPVLIHPTKEEVTKGDRILDAFSRMSDLAFKKNVNLLFVIPPIVNQRNKKENTKEVLDLYQKIATVSKRPIYNYGNLPIPESNFRDKDSHLNKEGRVVFSTALARVIKESYKINRGQN